MASPDIDAYLASLDAPKRDALQALRKTIRAILPDAEECISYGLPAFRVRGEVVAGFKKHLSYLPHSGTVLASMKDDLTPYTWTSGALQFPIDAPLPKELVEKLIDRRLQQIQGA